MLYSEMKLKMTKAETLLFLPCKILAESNLQGRTGGRILLLLLLHLFIKELPVLCTHKPQQLQLFLIKSHCTLGILSRKSLRIQPDFPKSYPNLTFKSQVLLPSFQMNLLGLPRHAYLSLLHLLVISLLVLKCLSTLSIPTQASRCNSSFTQF